MLVCSRIDRGFQRKSHFVSVGGGRRGRNGMSVVRLEECQWDSGTRGWGWGFHPGPCSRWAGVTLREALLGSVQSSGFAQKQLVFYIPCSWAANEKRSAIQYKHTILQQKTSLCLWTEKERKRASEWQTDRQQRKNRNTCKVLTFGCFYLHWIWKWQTDRPLVPQRTDCWWKAPGWVTSSQVCRHWEADWIYSRCSRATACLHPTTLRHPVYQIVVLEVCLRNTN